MAAFPVIKLGALLLSQLSKPLANKAKEKAKTSPFFRNYICLPPAQFYHWWEVKMRMMSMNMGVPMNVPKLSEAKAIELGAELVGETVIFSVAALIFMAEFVRSARKEAAKEDVRRQEMLRIQADLKDLYFAKAKIETEVKELVRVLHVNVNVPHDSFKPDTPNFESIPIHHRNDTKEEANTGFFASVVSYWLDAMDFIKYVFPSKESKEEPKEEIKSDQKQYVSDMKSSSSLSSSSPTPTPTHNFPSESGSASASGSTSTSSGSMQTTAPPPTSKSPESSSSAGSDDKAAQSLTQPTQ